MLVALSGSRHHKNNIIFPIISRIMLAAEPSISWGIGCCPTGLDSAAVSIANHYKLQYTFFKAATKNATDLRARTLSMVSKSSALIAFPISMAIRSSGTWLAVGAAAKAGKKVYVFSHDKADFLPSFKNISFWQSTFFPGIPNIPFYSPVLNSLQVSIPI